MSPGVMFFIELLWLALFGWYFATDFGTRKRVLALVLVAVAVGLSIYMIYPPDKKIPLGLDIKGGTSFLIKLQSTAEKEVTPALLDQAVEVIRKRVDKFGGSEPIISPVGKDRILVQIPGLSTERIQEARQQLSQVAKLEFRLVYPDNGDRLRAIDAGTDVIPPEYKIETHTMHADENGKKPESERILVKKKADLGGEHVSGANAYFGNEGWGVQLRFDSEGAKTFGEITEKSKGYRFAIVLDGNIQSAPVIRDAIYGGSAQITGRFSETEARGLASVLENPLQTPVSIEEERSVSPTLGLDSIRASIMAGLVGLAITLVCVLIYYRFAGVIACVALLVNIVLLIGSFQLIPGGVVLTLPGIAGIILTIGLAVDASVLIYERLREELALGKTLATAMQAAYEKAFSSIFDANVTTLITATILFWKASGPVRGFAIALTLGILASLFTALIVGRNIFAWFVDNGWVKKVRMLHLISSQHINFLGKGLLAVLASVALMIAGATSFYLKGEKNFGVDFKGGDLLTLSSPAVIDIGQVRHALETMKVTDEKSQPVNLAEASIQESAQGGKYYITIRTPLNTSDQIKGQLPQALPSAQLKVEGSERVGALVGGELARNSLIALGLGILGILIFVTFRFELSFAVGAIIAVLHDVIITVGVFSLLGRELSLTLVGAILTIAGYSINDTIVVYDRIREGLASSRRGSIEQIMNDSINQTLSRTILTSTVTLIPIVCLFFFGGSVLRDFALAIIIGVAVGTYSSIFIASPIVLWWTRARGGSASLRREIAEKAAAATGRTT